MNSLQFWRHGRKSHQIENECVNIIKIHHYIIPTLTLRVLFTQHCNCCLCWDIFQHCGQRRLGTYYSSSAATPTRLNMKYTEFSVKRTL